MTLDGQGGIAAVLIAPGSKTEAQSRPSNLSNGYLEDSNTTAPSFVSSDPLDPDNFNDRVMTITIDEIMSSVVRIVADIVKTELDGFHVMNSEYPLDQAAFEAGIAPAAPWFAANYGPGTGVVTYTRITGDSASLTFAGCDNISFQLDFAPSAITQTGSRC
jgi:hypothetical protein